MFSYNTYKYGATVKELKTTKSPLVQLLKKFPNGAWNYMFLSDNPNITWEYIQKHKDKPWSDVCVARNPNLTWEIIHNNPEYACWHLFANPLVKWEDVPYLLSRTDLWKMGSLPLGLPTGSGPYGTLSESDCWTMLSMNPNLTWEIVKGSSGSGVALPMGSVPSWNWMSLTQNPSVITWDILTNDPAYHKWASALFAFSKNPNMTWDIVKKNCMLPWRSDNLCENPSVVTPENVHELNTLRLRCDHALQRNPNFTEKDLRKIYIRSYWDTKPAMSAINPNVTYRFACDNIRHFPFLELSMNKFLNDPTVYNRTIRNKRNLRKYAVENLDSTI